MILIPVKLKMISHKKIRFSKERVNWIGKRDINMLGTPLPPNEGIANEYARNLQKIVNGINKDIRKVVAKLLKSDQLKKYAMKEKKPTQSYGMDEASISDSFVAALNVVSKRWKKIYTRLADVYTDKVIKQSNENNIMMTSLSFEDLSGGMTISTDYISEDLKQVISSIANENVSLIKTTYGNYFDEIEQAVVRSITGASGGGLGQLQETINKALKGKYKKYHNKAKNTALDQTRKMYSYMSKARMESAGISKFRWKHSGAGQRPRKLHQAMDGNIYSFDDLPIINEKTGARGIPAEEINCRCFMQPIIELEDGTVI